MKFQRELCVAFLCAGWIVACGAPSEAPSENSSGALTFHPDPCLAAGHAPVCDAAGNEYWNACSATQAGVTSTGPCATCLVNPSCTDSLKTSPGFDPLILPTAPGTYGPAIDDAFEAELVAAGCEPERYYSLTPSADLPIPILGGGWSTAICPRSFTESAAELAGGTSGVIACDTCTGNPGPDRVVVAWMSSAFCEGAWRPCAVLPNGGCSSFQCMKQAQETAVNAGPDPEDAGPSGTGITGTPQPGPSF